MENPTPGVTAATDAEKGPDQIEREMATTRDSITEKVALLENQVLGNIQSVTSGVTDAVDAVRDAVTSAPGAMSDTVKHTVAAVKESVMETVRSIDVTGCIQKNPWSALGTSALSGFLAGYFLGGGGRSRPVMARSAPVAEPVAAGGGFQLPGVFDELFGMLGKEVRQIAESALSSASAALKQSISGVVPGLVDNAVHRVTDATGATTGPTDTTRVHGPNYAARG